jgi:hypothetical protein
MLYICKDQEYDLYDVALLQLHGQRTPRVLLPTASSTMLDISNTRRKLRGRRHGAAADASRHAPVAQHASTEFKWASDRQRQQEQAAPTLSQIRASAGSSAATTLGGDVSAGSIPAAATAVDALSANEFKWISDYVEDAHGESFWCAAVHDASMHELAAVPQTALCVGTCQCRQTRHLQTFMQNR